MNQPTPLNQTTQPDLSPSDRSTKPSTIIVNQPTPKRMHSIGLCLRVTQSVGRVTVDSSKGEGRLYTAVHVCAGPLHGVGLSACLLDGYKFVIRADCSVLVPPWVVVLSSSVNWLPHFLRWHGHSESGSGPRRQLM